MSAGLPLKASVWCAPRTQLPLLAQAMPQSL
jgi:hypothetical protein